MRSPLVLTLDSDVEFVAPGWLSEMVQLLERGGLAALGRYEPGRHGYRPRLAPYALLLRTRAVRALGVSFRGVASFGSVEERDRWASRPPSFTMEPDELALYPTAQIYPTGAMLFERLQDAGLRWGNLPPPVAAKLVHRGHMSWASGEEDYMLGAPPRFRDHHAAALAEVRVRLRRYQSR